MTGNRPLARATFPRLIHGADYNPEQWLHMPEILEEDLRLMELAGCNAVSVGMFSWSALEPEEGRYRFEWLDRVMEGLAARQISVILGTPTGSRPAWLSQRYPEVLRVAADRRRNLHGLRHNHCYTSPVYRRKAQAINRKLAERYGKHPALLMWHVSNEYGGECHCELCQRAFREWLRRRYQDSLEKLNLAWWTAFWSHTFSDWEQIESPAPHGEPYLNGLILDWKRFVTAQTVDFMRAEMAPLRELTPGIPVTSNMMGTYPGLDYWKLAGELDLASWDSYPAWHAGRRAGESRNGSETGGAGGESIPPADWKVAADTAFAHNIMRCLKGGRPFMLMESTPTFSNWHEVHKLKRPGMHLASSLLAIAHGSETVQYFQWRKSRGSWEKFHGAVVDHAGRADTRVFAEVRQVGQALQRLQEVAGSSVPAEVAIVFDWENRWALEEASGLRLEAEKGYEHTCKAHHDPLWRLGVPVDVVNEEADLSGYRLVIAPMLYMVRPGVAESLEGFVRGGGTLVLTYWSGIVDENDLCFLGGFPGPLRSLLGIRSEEIDGLYPWQSNLLCLRPRNPLGLSGEYQVGDFCDLVRVESAQVLAEYGRDFYRGRPALTANRFGAGSAYYLASRTEGRFLEDFYGALVRMLALRRALSASFPEGVSAQLRRAGERQFIFLFNFDEQEHLVELGPGRYLEKLSGRSVAGSLRLEGYGVRVLQG